MSTQAHRPEIMPALADRETRGEGLPSLLFYIPPSLFTNNGGKVLAATPATKQVIVNTDQLSDAMLKRTVRTSPEELRNRVSVRHLHLFALHISPRCESELETSAFVTDTDNSPSLAGPKCFGFDDVTGTTLSVDQDDGPFCRLAIGFENPIHKHGLYAEAA